MRILVVLQEQGLGLADLRAMARFLIGVTVPFTANMFLRSQLTRLTELGHEVHIVSSSGDALGELNSVEGVDAHVIEMSRRPSPFADIRALVNWIQLLKILRPDVLVVSTPKASALGLLAAVFHRVRTKIYHVRGLRLEGQRGAARLLSTISEIAMVRVATVALCDSESLRQQLARLPGIPGCKLVVLGRGSACGVDCERFKPVPSSDVRNARRKLDIHDDEIVVGYVGRVVKDKGVVALLEAVRQLRSRGVDARLVVAGPAEDSEFENATKASDRAWLVRLDGVVDPAEILPVIDVFVLPSVREGMPISLLEASAAGVPVITTDATGCRDAIVPGETGLAVPVGDLGALGNALGDLCNDRRLRQELGSQGRAFVLSEFSQETVDKRVVEFMESFLTDTCS